MNPRDEHNLERLIHQTLRELPPLAAPSSLEGRVLAELARRAAQPWWRKSFIHWPLGARMAFFFLSALIVALLIAGLLALTRGEGAQFLSQLGARFAWVSALRDVGAALVDAGVSILRALPPLWLYGGIAFVAGCYVTLMGVGATAWRVFHVNR